MEYHFSVKDVMVLSGYSSEVLNSILSEKNILLPKRILTYALAQQIMIQISTEKELSHLRGIGGRITEYTMHQLLQFITKQNIDIDTHDYLYRLWTVVLSNSYTLDITDEEVKGLLNSNHRNEYLHEVLNSLTSFVDGIHDLDGQPLMVAKESLRRFSSKSELVDIAHDFDIELPNKLSHQQLAEKISLQLEDDTEDFVNHLNSISFEELVKFASDNFVQDTADLETKEIVDHLLSDYESNDVELHEIEYKEFLEIPSLASDSYYEEDEEPKFEVSDELSLELTNAIAAISGELPEITEEEAKQELDNITHVPDPDVSLLKERIVFLEKKLEKHNSNSIDVLVEKVSDLEIKIEEPNSMFSKRLRTTFRIWFIIATLVTLVLYLNHIL